MNKPIPKDGEIVWVQGHEMIASNVRILSDDAGKFLRFTGTCTDHPSNDQIRHTSYNGGTYGWRILK